MTIQTKYEVGNVVWLMRDNQAISTTVSLIKVTVRQSYHPYISYRLEDEGNIERQEKELFPSKASLLESL